MKSKLLQLQSKNSIADSVQKDQIIKLIKGLGIRQETPRLWSTSPSSPREKPTLQKGKRRQYSFNIRKQITRPKQPKQSQTNGWEIAAQMQEKINYFSVRQNYQQVMSQTNDEKVIRALKEELVLSPSFKNRYSETSKPNRGCNYFQNILNRQNKIRHFFQKRSLNFHAQWCPSTQFNPRKEPELLLHDIQSRVYR